MVKKYFDDYDPIREKIASIAFGKNIADFSCGPGWAGGICLEHQAKFVKFSDARIERLNKEALKNYTNYSVEFVDLNFPNNHKDYLKDIDLIIYFGHLYHATNHKEILDYMIDSNCTEFLIDSKMFPEQEKDMAEMLWYFEPTQDEKNIWHPENQKEIKVGRPNLQWVLDYLDTKSVKIKEILKIPMRHIHRPAHNFINFTIHFTK